MDHILKTIEDIEARISERERENRKDRSMINNLCDIAGIEHKYQIDDNDVDGQFTSGGRKSKLSVKPDEFYSKPLSTAVRTALNMLRSIGRAPANIEAIYDLLIDGGFDFESKSRDTAIQGLSVSIGKNSALFVKLKNGLIGLKEWYGTTPRQRVRLKSDQSDGATNNEYEPESNASDDAQNWNSNEKPSEGEAL